MPTRWFTALTRRALLAHSTVVANAQTTLPHSHIAGELLIAPRSGVSDAELEGVYNGHGGQKIRILAQINVHHIRVSEIARDAIEAALSKNPKVASVEKNFVAQANRVPNDPNFVNKRSWIAGAALITTSFTSLNPVADVEFYVDGALYTIDSSSPYSFVWDTTTFSGTHKYLGQNLRRVRQQRGLNIDDANRRADRHGSTRCPSDGDRLRRQEPFDHRVSHRPAKPCDQSRVLPRRQAQSHR